jgi:hypothetical protein
VGERLITAKNAESAKEKLICDARAQKASVGQPSRKHTQKNTTEQQVLRSAQADKFKWITIQVIDRLR